METVAVIGLGYVGLPLALAFGQFSRTIGVDTDAERIKVLRRGRDPTGESPSELFAQARHIEFTGDAALLKFADIVIITVPTPITSANQPDLSALIDAGTAVGQSLKPGAVVILESTVYPGLTDELLGPLLERESGLRRGFDFKLAYSPERINPGDREHSLRNTVKVVAAEDDATLDRVAALYEQIVDAGIYRAPSIRVAEAAKVIENTQRDLNIALMNELAIIFNRLGIDTLDVLETAGTKWNFLPFRPGLVGGHCIGVDPYYLTYKAETIGYHPEVILAGRRINDNFGRYLAARTVKALIRAGVTVQGACVAVLGVAFKENCPDIRNSRVFDLIAELKEYGIEVVIVDPVVDPVQVLATSGVGLVGLNDISGAAATVLAVAHESFTKLTRERVRAWSAGPVAPVIDVKGILGRDDESIDDGLRIERL